MHLPNNINPDDQSIFGGTVREAVAKYGLIGAATIDPDQFSKGESMDRIHSSTGLRDPRVIHREQEIAEEREAETLDTLRDAEVPYVPTPASSPAPIVRRDDDAGAEGLS